MDYVTFGLILDDLLRADGLSRTGLLGGGGPQSAFGMRLWSDSVGLVGRVGADLPEAARVWLRDSGIDTLGLTQTAWPTLRALQRLDADGRRRHSWLVSAAAVGAQLEKHAADLPASYQPVRGWHLGVHPDEPDWDFLAGLRARGGRLSVETFRPAAQSLAPKALARLLRATDIFSPNEFAAASLVGPAAPELLARRLLDAGAAVLALRLGARGSLVAEAVTGHAVWIPAFPVAVVDAVGAGNAYCGAFLTGWVETGDLLEAGLRGAAAASLIIEAFGVPLVTPAACQLAQSRQQALRPLARTFQLSASK